jgi:predicted Zn-dependent protease with MMP-like domain
VAQAEVDDILAALPQKVRSAALVPTILLEPFPDEATLADGTEPDTLGLFIGGEMAEHESGEQALPPHILLYLENLWDFAEMDETIFREEVRVTLLHELGHFFGLDEEDLEARGLD